VSKNKNYEPKNKIVKTWYTKYSTFDLFWENELSREDKEKLATEWVNSPRGSGTTIDKILQIVVVPNPESVRDMEDECLKNFFSKLHAIYSGAVGDVSNNHSLLSHLVETLKAEVG